MLLKVVIFSVIVLMLAVSYTTNNPGSKIENEVTQSQTSDLEESKIEPVQLNQSTGNSNSNSNIKKAPSFSLTFKSDRLSAKAEAAPLGLVLKELGRLTDIKIYISSSIAAEEVTVEIDNFPLEQGIKQVLAKQSYTLTYEDVKASDIESGQDKKETQMRIAELRLVSGSGAIVDVQDLDKNRLLAEASFRNKEKALAVFKSRVAEALANSDVAALNGLMHEIRDHADPEAAANVFNEATAEQKALTGNVSTTGENAQDSVANDSVAQDSNDGDTQAETTANKEETSNFSALEARVYQALLDSDTLILNEIMHDINNDSDKQGAMEAFGRAAARYDAGKGRKRLK